MESVYDGMKTVVREVYFFMRHRMIWLEGGVRQLAQAREALGEIPGVAAAELVMGRNAVRVWYGDEIAEGTLRGALHACGLDGARIE